MNVGDHKHDFSGRRFRTVGRGSALPHTAVITECRICQLTPGQAELLDSLSLMRLEYGDEEEFDLDEDYEPPEVIVPWTPSEVDMPFPEPWRPLQP